MLNLQKHNRLIFIVMLVASIAVTTSFIMQLSVFSSKIEDVALNNAVEKSSEREAFLKSFLKSAERSITALRNSASFRAFLEDPANKAPFAELALNIASGNRDIMGIRFLEPSGREVVRVFRDDLTSEPMITPESSLQNKFHRYYIQHALNIPIETVWFSNLDLNMEFQEVEVPFKETLRVLRPVLYLGEFKGVLVINYHMERMIDELFAAPLYKMILTDGQGNILVHHNEDRSWSHYKGDAGLEVEIPEFRHVLENDTYRGNTFFSRHLDLPTNNNLILVLALNDDYLALQKSQFLRTSVYSSVTTLVITALVGLVLVALFRRFFNEYDVREKSIHSLVKLNHQINSLLEKNKAYMEMASDGIHVMNKDGDLVAFSHSFAHMLGYKEEELSALNIRDWQVKLSPEQMKEKMSAVTGSASKYETRHKRKDGSPIDVEVTEKWIVIDGERLLYASSRDISERKQMEQELEKLANTDFLTQLPTRRVFDERLSEELERCRRNDTYLATAVMMDVDHFKEINDSYGHAVGDIALKHLTNVIQDEIRRVDLVARFGGDEFALILVSTDEVTAINYLERMRQKLAMTPLIVEGYSITMSVSIGIAAITSVDEDSHTVLKKADKALYRAKDLGRNRIEVFHDGNGD
ncbi:sensor domain-containing diguanylate cyclase [Reinekea marinisedimentorum]|uniref:PAS domain S-box-containing protein/diguanylate cyclase (GGDEF)-like protein n=1 Tax=Reinekea marinisedimentorum TaxID=230495 RepID=A0A4R3I1A1_9GAMM|nr:diguanylate cyclase [Reinekea marinisedimentorum]TCS38974.1 PAS domain S-box-containing protein/diguanylate cyclase (GGDEF)-like protein [Reinekea marinisedimentorum]